jgi:hypothetical protein
MKTRLVSTCLCGRTHVQPCDPANMWDVMAAAETLAALSWGHDAQGRRLCPDCREANGIPYNPGPELPPPAQGDVFEGAA